MVMSRGVGDVGLQVGIGNWDFREKKRWELGIGISPWELGIENPCVQRDAEKEVECSICSIESSRALPYVRVQEGR